MTKILEKKSSKDLFLFEDIDSTCSFFERTSFHDRPKNSSNSSANFSPNRVYGRIHGERGGIKRQGKGKRKIEVESGAQRSYSPIHTALASLYASRAPSIMQLDDVWEHRARLYSLSTEIALCTPLTTPAVFRFRSFSPSLSLSLSLPPLSLPRPFRLDHRLSWNLCQRPSRALKQRGLIRLLIHSRLISRRWRSAFRCTRFERLLFAPLSPFPFDFFFSTILGNFGDEQEGSRIGKKDVFWMDGTQGRLSSRWEILLRLLIKISADVEINYLWMHI